MRGPIPVPWECIRIEYIFNRFGAVMPSFLSCILCSNVDIFNAFVCVPFRKDVDFCGYSCPHPFEKKMHIRVQTTGDLPSNHSLTSKYICAIIGIMC